MHVPNRRARTKQTELTEQTIEIYALAVAFARTNVPLSSERTRTLFHHPREKGWNKKKKKKEKRKKKN